MIAEKGREKQRKKKKKKKSFSLSKFNCDVTHHDLALTKLFRLLK